VTLSRLVAQRAATLAGRGLPDHVAQAARLHLLDALGVGLAASASAVGRPYRHLAAETARGGAASVFGQVTGAAPADAALVNGGLIHSLEYDDTHTGSIVHGSAVLAPAALAAAEAAGAGGQALLAAYALGWEVLVRIGLAAPGAFQARGFQVTSAGGALAAALVAALLGGLDEDRTVAALGIALSQASGVFEFLSNGASVKSLHPGWAAHAGLLAARLTASGMTGPETALEGRYGLFASFAGDAAAPARLAEELTDLGGAWHLAGAAFKLYPCCHYIHPFIEAAALLRERGIAPSDIDRLTCRVPAGAAPVICEPWPLKQDPPTPHAARWSLPVVVAMALHGPVNLESFEAAIPAPVRTLATRIGWEELPDADFPRAFAAGIVCACADGRQETVRVADVYGNRSRPADPSRVRAKFRANAGRALAPAAVARLEAAVDGLGRTTAVADLSAALRTVRRAEEQNA
jgi:2-methylcitrate dehydratase PrpD